MISTRVLTALRHSFRHVYLQEKNFGSVVIAEKNFPPMISRCLMPENLIEFFVDILPSPICERKIRKEKQRVIPVFFFLFFHKYVYKRAFNRIHQWTRDFALRGKFFSMIYGNATAIFSNKSIGCRVWGVASISGTAGSLDGRAAAKGSSRTEPRRFYAPVAVNTSTLTRAILKVQKLYVRPSFEYSTSGGAVAGVRARARAALGRACTCTRAHTRASRRFMLLIFAYERRGRLRAYGKSFTRASISSRLTRFPAIRL